MADSGSGSRPSEDREDEEAEGTGREAGEREELRRRVEEKYDFEDFTPADMAEMTVEEWEVAFDPDTWITGVELLDRVEADLKARVRNREVFAVVERLDEEGVLAYSDEGYAVVYPDGSVDGEGSVLRDVEPTVALCSMEEYDPPAMPDAEDSLLPEPEEVPEGSGELGNLLMQTIAGVQVLAGLFLLVSPLLFDLGGRGSALLTTVVGLGFIGIGVFLLLLVANARLSDRFRAEEYRQRLRAVNAGSEERPDFVPVGDEATEASDGDGTDAPP